MLAEMTSADLFDWMLYYRVEPDAETRADARHGINTWWIARTMGGVKDKSAADYIPKFEAPEPPKQQTVEEAVQVAVRTTAMLGGSFHDPRKAS